MNVKPKSQQHTRDGAFTAMQGIEKNYTPNPGMAKMTFYYTKL